MKCSPMPSHRAPAPLGHDLVAAGVILRRAVGGRDRWLLLRAEKHGEWGFPKGHLERGETPEQAALRECAEECGIAVLALEGQPLELHYRLPSGKAKQVFYFPAVTATAQVVLSDEHSEYLWASGNEVARRLPHANVRSMFAAYQLALGRDRRRGRTETYLK